MWQPGWEGVWGRMDTCICMAEFLHCPPENIRTLLIACTPLQNKKLKILKKNMKENNPVEQSMKIWLQEGFNVFEKNHNALQYD